MDILHQLSLILLNGQVVHGLMRFDLHEDQDIVILLIGQLVKYDSLVILYWLVMIIN